nr:hypothetical protein [Tanacetum cinerariifolium]
MPILVTSKKALEQVKRLHAMNVGIKGTTGEIVWSERTKTTKTKSKVLKHVEWCMPLEEEKPNKTLTTLRMRLKLKMMVHVPPNATSATDLAIKPVTVGVLQMPILLTSKKALEQVRRLHATNVGIKGTIREIVRSKRTKTMKTKSKVLRHVEWCMPLEVKKPNKTLTTLRLRLKLKRESCLA